MKNLIADFPKHLRDAISIVSENPIRYNGDPPIENVIITGLGGSGISGTVVAEMLAGVSVPVFVNKNYTLPAFAGRNTLVIACSYSGDTEETLSAVRAALSRKAQVACITSGGKLLEIAREHQLNVLSMPGGNPPRSMMAYSFVFLLHILRNYSAADFQYSMGLDEAIRLLETTAASIRDEARKLAKAIHGTIPVIYAVSGCSGIATRWRQQFNENAKMLAWESEIPEMNHNELVGWEGGSSHFSAIFLRNASDHDRNQKRIAINQSILKTKTPHIFEVWSQGKSAEARILYLIHFGDWVSWYLSELNGADIMDIRSIDFLKSELSKIPFHE